LTELHGGAMKIRSTEGVGTIISIRLPLKQAVTKTIEADNQKRPATSSGSKSRPKAKLKSKKQIKQDKKAA